MNDFLHERGLLCCDDVGCADVKYTFHCEPRNASSFIDHFLVSRSLARCIVGFEVVDSGINFSDHLPILLTLSKLGFEPVDNKHRPTHKVQRRLRWDRADLMTYYYTTGDYLYSIDLNELCASFLCPNGCKCDKVRSIESVYAAVVNSLRLAAGRCCPVVAGSFFKSFRDDELTELKTKSIDAHALWKASGCPRRGPVFTNRCHARAQYRRAIKERKTAADNHISNDLHEYLINKDCAGFWQCWKGKLSSKQGCSDVVEGQSDHAGIANVFASSFNVACTPNSPVRSAELKSEFVARYADYFPRDDELMKCVNVEIVDRCTRALKLRKASGVESIDTEHVVYAHPRLCVILSMLFNSMLIHGTVPLSFCVGIVVLC